MMVAMVIRSMIMVVVVGEHILLQLTLASMLSDDGVGVDHDDMI